MAAALPAAHTPLPPRPVMITIDDAYRSTRTVAFPLLRELGLPAALFVPADFVGNRHPLWPDRIEHALATTTRSRLELGLNGDIVRLDLGSEAARIAACRMLFDELSRMGADEVMAVVEAVEHHTGRALEHDGGDEMFAPLGWGDVIEMQASRSVEVGSHSVTHPVLARCPAARQADEIAASKAAIERATGRRCDVFCYPGGQSGDFEATGLRVEAIVGYGYNPLVPLLDKLFPGGAARLASALERFGDGVARGLGTGFIVGARVLG